MRVLFFGMLGDFSRIVLQELLEAGIDICGVITPAVGGLKQTSNGIVALRPSNAISELPVINNYFVKNIVHIAWEHGILAFEMADPRNLDSLKTVQELKPDICLVVCFSMILPPRILSLSPLGFLNLHPSLLPAFRGPEPLFWIFRNGVQDTGVTLHFVDEGVDTGDIVLQAKFNLADGISGQEAEKKNALIGAELMIRAVELMRSGQLKESPQLGDASYFPSPGAADFKIPLEWTARHAFNFMRGTAEWGKPYLVEVEGKELLIKTAVSFDEEATMKRPFNLDGGEVRIRFNQGVLHALLW